ncbi:MAG: hypothetical protein Roseis2KO_19910 [Roseivirga sp.]
MQMGIRNENIQEQLVPEWLTQNASLTQSRNETQKNKTKNIEYQTVNIKKTYKSQHLS